MLGVDGYVSSHLATIMAHPDALDQKYLLYFLSTVLAQGLVQDHSYPSLNKGNISAIEVFYPTALAEQRRIVGILDEAFAGLQVLRANAEKNLGNARALFESQLNAVFTQRGEEWVEKKLEKVLGVQPQNGWSPPAANHSESGTPVLTLSSVTGFDFKPDKIKFTSASTDPRRHYWVKNGDFLITRSNTPELVGHVAIASGIYKPTIYPDLIMRINPVPDTMLTEFLYYQMRSHPLRKEITSRAQGANPTMVKISNGAVRTLPIAVPAIATQRTIVEILNALSIETRRLAAVYQQKLNAIAELKQSILQKAFAGELTMEVSSVVIAPTSAGKEVDAKRTTAMVLALAYERHKRQKREKSFGHVKAQKILHMVEGEAEFDLWRQPIRDAAGPNDFPHMLAAEDWAEANQYFRFPKSEDRGYQFESLAKFGELTKAAHGIEPSIRTKIERVIDLFIPMDKQKAEVFATVYAAWNNLLIEKRKPTDDEIIRAAREEWHPSKLDIPRPEFVEALRLLKDKNCAPTGRGRLVQPPPQGRLPL